MMKQAFTKLGVFTLLSLLCPAFLYAQVVTDERDRKSTRLNSSHQPQSRMPSSA